MWIENLSVLKDRRQLSLRPKVSRAKFQVSVGRWRDSWKKMGSVIESCFGVTAGLLWTRVMALGSKSSRMIWGFFILIECSKVDQTLMWSFDGSMIMLYLCKILIGKPDLFSFVQCSCLSEGRLGVQIRRRTFLVCFFFTTRVGVGPCQLLKCTNQ